MLSRNELRYTFALQRVPNLGDISAKKLLHLVGSAEGIFKEKKRNLLKIDGIGSFRLKELNEKALLDAADLELQYIEKEGINISYFKDKNYPEQLKHCIDGPILFFYSGNLDWAGRRMLSVVGTRNATSYGVDFCEKLIAQLAPINPVIVSGFAYGIDITAHRAAMENGLQTIGCLAHGLNQIYPRAHKKFIPRMETNGGFITEFWSDDPFDRTNFLRRNRIIAGMSEATVVIESAKKGGSLVTADIANSYNREVFAVPGKVSDSWSQGCNHLIKTQQAHLLSNAEDILFMLGWEEESRSLNPKQMQLFPELSKEETLVWEFLKTREKESLDLIALGCAIPTYKAASLLLSLEMKRLVRPLPGKLFQYING